MIIHQLTEKYTEELGLKLIAGKGGLKRSIRMPEFERPGLCLTGYLKGFVPKILIFGKVEIDYLKSQTTQQKCSSLKNILTPRTPLTIVTQRLLPPQEMIQKCEEHQIPLFRSHLPISQVMQRLTTVFAEEFAISSTCHGSFVDIFGVGVLIQGEAAVGKSEAALGLIKRGHRLISDDVVKISKRDKKSLEGCGFDASRHHLELKGVGIINIARLYGMIAVKEKKSLDIVVKLEVWDDTQFYDQAGSKKETITFLGVEVPFHMLPIRPGRDVVLLLETLALNHRLKNLSAIEKKGRAWESNI